MCCAVLCCAVLCCAVLCCAVQEQIILFFRLNLRSFYLIKKNLSRTLIVFL